MQITEEFTKSQCYRCKHLIVDPSGLYCAAFAENGIEGEIPEDILADFFRHTVPHPKQTDSKILFTPKHRD